MTIIINRETCPKTYQEANRHLDYGGSLMPFASFASKDSEEVKRIEIMKSHELLKCGGCKSCAPKERGTK